MKRHNYGGSDSPAKRRNVNFISLLKFWGVREVSTTVNPIVEGLGASLIQTSGQLSNFLTPRQDEERGWTDRQISNGESDQI